MQRPTLGVRHLVEIAMRLATIQAQRSSVAVHLIKTKGERSERYFKYHKYNWGPWLATSSGQTIRSGSLPTIGNS